MSVVLSILGAAIFVGILFVVASKKSVEPSRRRRFKDSGGGGNHVQGSSESGGFDCGADGGCD